MPTTNYQNLPLADPQRGWDAGRAEASVRTWASDGGTGNKEDMDWPKYRKAFFWYDAENAENFTGYKLGFAEVIDGELYAVPRGIYAVAAVLQGARGGVDIPPADVEAVRRHVARYYAKMEATPPWEQDAATTPTIKRTHVRGHMAGVF